MDPRELIYFKGGKDVYEYCSAIKSEHVCCRLPMHVEGFDAEVCNVQMNATINFIISNYMTPDMLDMYTKET
jgi:hypothetical protein